MDFPDYYTLLIRGPAGSGKFAFSLSLIKKYLEKGEKIVFITTDRTPEEIEASLTEFNLNKELDNLYFVDGSLWSTEEKEKWLQKSRKKVIGIQKDIPFEVLIKISKGLEEIGKSRIFFDSVSSFLFRSDVEDSLESLGKLNDRIKEKFGFAAYTIQEDIHPPKVYSKLEAMVDGVIEMRYKDMEGVIEKQLRIKFLKGFNYEPGWKSIDLEKGGLWVTR